MSSYTTNLRLTKQANNENPNTWGSVVNQQVIQLIEDAISGVTQVDMTGASDVDISATVVNGGTDTARYAVLELTGTVGANINLIVPAVNKIYIIKAGWTGAFTVTVKPVGGSTGVVFNTGQGNILYTKGTNITSISGSALLVANNLSDLADAAAARTNLGLGDVATMNVADLNIPTVAAVLSAIYPVGSLYYNSAVNTNPATLLGFGTWASFATGRAVIGVGIGTDINTFSKTFALGDTPGEYQHTQTTSELAAHFHTVASFSRDLASGSNSGYFVSGNTQPAQNTSIVGSSLPMQWLQPSIAVYIWTRTA